MKKSIEEKVMQYGTYETRAYLYVLRGTIECGYIVRIRREYIGTTAALDRDNYTIVKKY